jgi:hypothetical protein
MGMPGILEIVTGLACLGVIVAVVVIIIVVATSKPPRDDG